MNWHAEQNVKRYRAMLASEADPARRDTIETLLSEEEAKLKEEPEAGHEARPRNIARTTRP